MPKLAKCLYCEETFDRNKEPFQPVGRRYAHQKCYDLYYTEEDYYKEEIYKFIKRIFGPNYKYAVIERQRVKFLKEGLTNKGIYYALKYHFEVKNGSVEKSEGRIGIVPYLYEEALEYYKNIDDLSKKFVKSIQEPKKEKIVNIENIKNQSTKKNQKINMDAL